MPLYVKGFAATTRRRGMFAVGVKVGHARSSLLRKSAGAPRVRSLVREQICIIFASRGESKPVECVHNKTCEVYAHIPPPTLYKIFIAVRLLYETVRTSYALSARSRQKRSERKNKLTNS